MFRGLYSNVSPFHPFQYSKLEGVRLNSALEYLIKTGGGDENTWVVGTIGGDRKLFDLI